MQHLGLEMGDGSTHIFTGERDKLDVARGVETVLAVARALAEVPNDPRAKRLLAEALELEAFPIADFVQRLLAEKVPLPVDLVQFALSRWFEDGRETWEWISKWCPSFLFVNDPTFSPVVASVWDVLDSLAVLPNAPEPGSTGTKLTGLAEAVAGIGAIQPALECAFAALSYFAADDPAAVPAANTAGRLARAAGDLERTVFAEARRALALAPRYASDESVRRPTAEALETVIRYWGPCDSVKPLREYIEHWVREIPVLRPLALVLLATHIEDWPTAPRDLPPYALTLSPSLDVAPEDLRRVVVALAPWMDFENLRLDLEDRPPSGVKAQASWDTWSLDHPSFRRAIPHGESILREIDLDELLLVIQHEATHVYSIVAGVGLAVTALRAAILDFEIDLWTEGGRSPSTEDFLSTTWALPRAGALQSLVQGEQLLELRRKLQIVQRVWAPVLEGIAIYGELCADPREMDETASRVAYLVANLVDVSLPQEAQSAGVDLPTIQRRTNEKAEERYGEALDGVGEYRLRAYLERWPDKYFAGYVAVRSVVSAWRERAGGDLAGTAAFRILLDAFVATSAPAVPSLDSPLNGFADRVLNGMLAWLESITDLGAHELREVAGNRAVITAADGVLKVTPMAEFVEPATAEVDRRFAEARRALTGAAADLDRVARADPHLRGALSVFAESLSFRGADPSDFARTFVEYAFTAPSLMPIARTSVPFWLNRPTRSLVCILRTTEHDYQHGRSSYQAASFPLNDESFDELERVMRTRAGTRMQVTRFADLVGLSDLVDASVPGINYLTFEFDDWLGVSPRGWLFTKSSAPDSVRTIAELRLHPPPAVEIEQRLGQARGGPSAARLLKWLDATNRWWVNDGEELPFDVEPWVQRVRDLANEVQAGAEDEDEDQVSRALLTWVLADAERATVLTASGLRVLYELSGTAVADFVRILQRSGSHPIDNEEIDGMVERSRELLGPLVELQRAGWDVTPPRGRPDRGSVECR